MTDDELLSTLAEPLPAEAESELFWARFGRDLDGAIDRQHLRRQQRRRRTAFLSGIAALLVGGLAITASMRAPHTRPAAVELDVPEDESATLAVEDLTDEEVARAIRVFPKGG